MNPFTRFARLHGLVSVASLVALTAALGFASHTLQSKKAPSGKLTQSTGQVSVNGASAAMGAAVDSDSSITTAARSSAVVSLGKLGRAEVLPQSTMKLSFDDSSVSVAIGGSEKRSGGIEGRKHR
jgi:hypothetical protein